jgi:Tol biopolymer transport system component
VSTDAKASSSTSTGRRGSHGHGMIRLVCLAVLGLLALLGSGAASAAAACPNEDRRSEQGSAFLPECRAYELVTPASNDDLYLSALNNSNVANQFATQRLSPDGSSVIYLSKNGSLPFIEGGSGTFDNYQAVRTAQGWQTIRELNPTGQEISEANPGGIADGHGYAFFEVVSFAGNGVGTLAEAGTANYLSEPDRTIELIGTGSLGTEKRAVGRYISPDGAHIVFTTGGGNVCDPGSEACPVLQLEPNAPPSGTEAVYERGPDGPTRVVSLLPGEVTPADKEHAHYQGASRDGTVIAFKIGENLYARVNGQRTEDLGVTGPFAGVSRHGEAVFYMQGGDTGDIFAHDVAADTTQQITTSGDATISTISADGSHVYFLSPSQLDGSEGTAGEPNLYVWSKQDGIDYVATVSPGDLEGLPALGTWTSNVTRPETSASNNGPGATTARTTPDGEFLLFESSAQLTSYDNGGHTEIYRYGAATGDIACVSCNPSGAPTTSDARLEKPGPPADEFKAVGFEVAIDNLTADGSRAFFETSEALLPRDVNGINDIYEWSARRDGTLALISSGRTPNYVTRIEFFGSTIERSFEANNLFGISPSGDDVIFGTWERLVPDGSPEGVKAVYDARVGGGFPVSVKESCQADACQPLGQAPGLGEARSGSFHGRGNVKDRRCRHGKQRAKPAKAPRCHRAHRKHQRGQKKRGGRASGSLAGPVPAGSPSAANTGGADGAPAAAAAQTASPAAGPATRAPEYKGFGIEQFNVAASTTAAGMHPDLSTQLAVRPPAEEIQPLVKDVEVELPPGLAGNLMNFPHCKIGELEAPFAACPVDSQVGVVQLRTNHSTGQLRPLFNLEAPPNMVARLGFYVTVVPVFVDIGVRAADGYRVVARTEATDGTLQLEEAEPTLWGVPADPSHDELRRTTFEAMICPGNEACLAGGKRTSGVGPRPLVNNPSACQRQPFDAALTSYQIPGEVFTAHAELPSVTDCDRPPFDPSLAVQPTSREAAAPTGLVATLRLPQTNSADLPATSALRDAVVTLPEGMTINPAAADGLAACSAAQVGFGKEVADGCPEAAKIGTATIGSPALPQPIQGTIYQRSPEPGQLFGLWLVSDDYGIHLKLPGKIQADPATGQLTTSFSETPQLPVEEIELELKGGVRAPLKNPDACGTYQTSYRLTPWADVPVVNAVAPMKIDQGCGQKVFSPKLVAGVANPVAGSYSPLIADFANDNGADNIAKISLDLPPGQLAKLAGVPLCPEGAAASGACPEGSRIGAVSAAVGAGPTPLWVPQPGKEPTAVYLAGPYKGAPYSVVAKVPAQAGPFDLGTVVNRSALDVDPDTARVSVETDPLPQILEGVPVFYRRLHVAINRDDFALAPTNCEEMALNSTITSSAGAVAHPSSRFQVGDCADLKFGPTLKLRLKGGTRRGSYPALRATVKAGKDEANIRKVSVRLPHSAFLAQEHINTVCTRVQFAADQCPKGSVYGWARALTPLLDQPLEGPVYLRSSSHPLPDLVVALRGQIDINLVGQIDSVRGGIRTTFRGVPDAPVSRFVLRMKGGSKGLIVNSTDICANRHRATVKMDGQNGKVDDSHPLLRARCK